jgi:UDPglucose 6-dehydrogenase
VREIISRHTSQPFDVVVNPEFLKEGSAVDDFMRPDRVVIGCDSPRARQVMGDLYAPFMRTQTRIQYTLPASAALGKYASNCMLAVRISFMNEIAWLASGYDADVDEVRRIVGSDSRIGNKFLFPGLGYGGSCFPKDVSAAVKMGERAQLELPVIAAADITNARQKRILLPMIQEHFGASLSGLRFAVWGLAFKPRTDDVREAPALVMIEELLRLGATVCAFDPEARETTRSVLGDRIDYADNALCALEDADALIVCTEWNEFRSPEFDEMRRRLKQPIIFDGRNVYDLDEMAATGWTYYSIGRRAVRPVITDQQPASTD